MKVRAFERAEGLFPARRRARNDAASLRGLERKLYGPLRLRRINALVDPPFEDFRESGALAVFAVDEARAALEGGEPRVVHGGVRFALGLGRERRRHGFPYETVYPRIFRVFRPAPSRVPAVVFLDETGREKPPGHGGKGFTLQLRRFLHPIPILRLLRRASSSRKGARLPGAGLRRGFPS